MAAQWLPPRNVGITWEGYEGPFPKKENVLSRDKVRATRGCHLSKLSHRAAFTPGWAALTTAPGWGRTRTKREWQKEAHHGSRSPGS